ncbi:unnamed protein product [Vicia faba]|uniref:Uncharacterized protein n=1 Tax=Vicia faba TaxID=3906 RepID=A0AAV1AV72_VICFA|nr:unnamed protein product [Vicia faba]
MDISPFKGAYTGGISSHVYLPHKLCVNGYLSFVVIENAIGTTPISKRSILSRSCVKVFCCVSSPGYYLRSHEVDTNHKRTKLLKQIEQKSETRKARSLGFKVMMASQGRLRQIQNGVGCGVASRNRRRRGGCPSPFTFERKKEVII